MLDCIPAGHPDGSPSSTTPSPGPGRDAAMIFEIKGHPVNHILVIEDELPMRRPLSIALKAHGYDVDVAENGRTGLDAAARNHPDLIILDLRLPDMAGVDVARGPRR